MTKSILKQSYGLGDNNIIDEYIIIFPFLK